MPEDCCTISSADCLPMPNIFEGKQSHQCHRVEDVESLPSISFPGFSTIIITSPLPRTCGLIALGEWLRADVVSALSFEAGAGRSSQLLGAATMSFCFFQSPIAGEPVATNGDPVRGRVVMKQSKKGIHLKRPTRRLPRASVASTPPSRGVSRTHK